MPGFVEQLEARVGEWPEWGTLFSGARSVHETAMAQRPKGIGVIMGSVVSVPGLWLDRSPDFNDGADQVTASIRVGNTLFEAVVSEVSPASGQYELSSFYVAEIDREGFPHPIDVESLLEREALAGATIQKVTSGITNAL